MTTITFESDGEFDFLYHDDEWKNYICDNFDENVVVIKNKTFIAIEEASWWNDAKMLIADLDNYNWDIEDFSQYETKYSEEQLKKVYEAYQKCRYSDDTEFIIKIAQIIKPGLELETGIARGYSQSEWVEIVYVKDSIKIDTFAAYFFGKLTEIHVVTDDEDYYDVMTHDEIFDLFHHHSDEEIEKILRDSYGIKDEEPIKIIKND